MQISEVRCDLLHAEGRAGRECRHLLGAALCTVQHLHGQCLCMHGHCSLHPKRWLEGSACLRIRSQKRAWETLTQIQGKPAPCHCSVNTAVIHSLCTVTVTTQVERGPASAGSTDKRQRQADKAQHEDWLEGS